MELITTFFSGPILPASILLCFLLGWSLLALLGTVELDLPGSNLNLDGDVDLGDATTLGDGAALLTLRWLNIGHVPLALWMGVLAIVWWLASATLWLLVDQQFFSPPGWLWSSLLVIKNLAIAVPVTKLVTNPMRSWFVTEKLNARSLVGQECQISSAQATPEFGQVKFKTDGAPLLLNVRTDGPHLANGTTVWITHYDAKNRVYLVSPTTTDSPQ